MSCCFRSSPCSPCAAALRGFLDEVAGLVGILGGVWLAGRYYGELGRIFSQYTTSQWVYIVAYVLILCMVMFVISMISRALHSFLKMAYADWITTSPGRPWAAQGVPHLRRHGHPAHLLHQRRRFH